MEMEDLSGAAQIVLEPEAAPVKERGEFDEEELGDGDQAMACKAFLG